MRSKSAEPLKPMSEYTQIGTSTGAIPQPVQIKEAEAGVEIGDDWKEKVTN